MGLSHEPLRVGLVTRSLAIGGAQRHLAKLSQAVAPDEVRLTVLLTHGNEPNDLLPAISPRVEVLVSPFHPRDPRVVHWLADRVRARGLSVVHSFLWTADAIAGLTRGLFLDLPLICSERGDRGHTSYYDAKRRLYDRLVTFPLASRFCANSMFGREILAAAGCDPAKIEVIPNGVDLTSIDSELPGSLRRELHLPEGSVVIGMVSRLADYKGVDTLMRAMALVRRKHGVYTVIVGDGDERPKLEALAQSLGLAKRVKFLGYRSAPVPLVKDFDVGVSTSRTEHCSNSILEYMACGKPVIATRVGGNPELVVDGHSGLLVEPHDPSGLARAIERLLSQPVIGKDMGGRGRSLIEERFRMESVAARFVALWKSVAGKVPGNGAPPSQMA